jgi:ribosomal protein S27E
MTDTKRTCIHCGKEAAMIFIGKITSHKYGRYTKGPSKTWPQIIVQCPDCQRKQIVLAERELTHG